MTRFARARGSKSSNERLPEEPTSWNHMKQQLQEKLKSDDSPKDNVEGKKWKANDFKEDLWEKSLEWVDIPTKKRSLAKSDSSIREKHCESKKKKKLQNEGFPELGDSKISDKKHKRMDRKSIDGAMSVTHEIEVSESSYYVAEIPHSKSKKNKIKICSAAPPSGDDNLHNILHKKRKNESSKSEATLAEGVKSSKKLKHKRRENSSEQAELNTVYDESDYTSLQTHMFQHNDNDKEGFKKSKAFDNIQSEGNMKRKKGKQHKQNSKNRYEKLNHKFKKFNEKEITVLHLNGRDIKIVKYDGFPIKVEDAENLNVLRKKMIAKGIPKNEIKATMKLERRKAEKALAREKKKVCFHCRGSGHVLSDCPKLVTASGPHSIGSGICFKCGSTEHKHFECRVTREQEFRYAKCFVCNEQGHIARQCPDNPRGLYPKGGACRICGDVTHFKKDCPDLVKEKEDTTVKLQTLSGRSLEILEEDQRGSSSDSLKPVKRAKTVKF